jgi:hypothetical protein
VAVFRQPDEAARRVAVERASVLQTASEEETAVAADPAERWRAERWRVLGFAGEGYWAALADPNPRSFARAARRGPGQ